MFADPRPKPPPGPLKDLPADLRPRERLLRDGGAGLTDAELLAVLLRTGRPGQSAVAMADELLDEHGGLGGLLHTKRSRLVRGGLRDAKAATLLAGLELARRLARAELPSGLDLLTHTEKVASYLQLRFGRLDQEVMGAIYLDLGHRFLVETEIYRGTLTHASVEPRTILREGLVAGAAGMLVFHTHPNGNPEPSRQDWDFTERLRRAGELLGIRLVDHLVLGHSGSWVSLRERGAC